MKKYYFILVLFILFLCPNAYAYDYTVTNNITAPSGSGSTGGHYLGLEIYNSGSQNNYTVNTRYNGTLSEIIYNLPLPSAAGECFTTNMDYTVTMEMATEDWRNHFSTPFVGAYSSATNWASSGVTFVSMKKIYFKFKIPASESSCVDFVYVRLSSPNVANTPFTGTSNWKLSKITLSDQYSSSGGSSGGSGGGGSSTPTPDPNQSIIDNDNENTNNIIENNNQNTQQILDSLNNTCPNIYNPSNYVNGSIGNNSTSSSLSSSNQALTTNWLSITANTTYYLTGDYNRIRWQLKDSSDNITYGGINNYVNTGNNTELRLYYYWSDSGATTGTQHKISISPSNYYCEFGSTTSKIDETNSAINGVNDTLNNSNVDSGTGSDFFNDFENEDFGLSSIITIPLNTIQSLTSQSCVALQVPIPFTGRNITLPCMTQVYQDNIPTIYNLWKIVSFGIIAYFIAIDIFHMVKGFKDPESDKVEVLDL